MHAICAHITNYTLRVYAPYQICGLLADEGHAPDKHQFQIESLYAQVIHVLGSYQVYTMPVFDMIEHQVNTALGPMMIQFWLLPGVCCTPCCSGSDDMPQKRQWRLYS